MRRYFLYFILILSIITIFIVLNNNTSKKNLIVPPKVAPTELVIIPQQRPFTILIVPGHDTNTGGANFKNIYERNLVVDVANDISTILSQDPKYKVIVARDRKVWNPIFASYFLDDRQAILDFKNQHQASDKLLLSSGQKKVIIDSAAHSIVNQKSAIELYGINKWANENDVDLIIHLHFNSSKRKNMNKPGTYHGFDIFIPERQRANFNVSQDIAENIYKELQKKFTPETNRTDYNSLFEDQSLIALGASDTLNRPAVLIEYAYIYEKMLLTYASQKEAIKEMAEQTVAGIKDYVNSKNN